MSKRCPAILLGCALFLLGNCTTNDFQYAGRLCTANLICGDGFACVDNVCVKKSSTDAGINTKADLLIDAAAHSDSLLIPDSALNSANKDAALKDLGHGDWNIKDSGVRDLAHRDVGQRDVGQRDVGRRDVGLKDIGTSDKGFPIPPKDGGKPRDRGLKDFGLRDVALKDTAFIKDAFTGDGQVCSSNPQCDDSISCTDDYCNGTSCEHTLSNGYCFIDNQCVPIFTAHPTEGCKFCDPNSSQYAWTYISCVTTMPSTISFSDPCGLTFDPSGRLIVGDANGNRIIIFDGNTTTIYGTGSPGLADGPASTAQFDNCNGVAVDKQGNIYVADSDNNAIRLISGGVVSTIAGGGSDGYADGPAATAQFNFPADLVVDSAGNIYVADEVNNLIRLISNGTVSTLAGSSSGYADGPALSAQFNHPRGLAINQAGELFVADAQNSRVRKIAGGQVTTFAGNNNEFISPQNLAFDLQNDLWVTDFGSHQIKKIVSGQVTTISGVSSSAGYFDGPASLALFNKPWGIKITSLGEIYVADENNQVIRIIHP